MSNSDNPFNHIVLPTQLPSAWPPAPIYWLLLLLAVVAIIAVSYFLRKRLQEQALCKQALNAVQQLSEQSSFAELNQILKALALAYYPRSEIAGLTGKDWYTFIEQHNPSENVLFNHMDSFCNRLYQGHSMLDKQDIKVATLWIKAFPKQVKLQQKKLNNPGAQHA